MVLHLSKSLSKKSFGHATRPAVLEFVNGCQEEDPVHAQ